MGDTGIGKTSFLLNYYVRNLKRTRRRLKIALLPLGIPKVDQYIEKISDKENTTLFLDALDEDTLAIIDHVQRVKDIVELTRNFKKILITCRTQFFSKDEEIPQETGIVNIGDIPPKEKPQYLFHKLYISPFTDKQIEKYLKRRYPLWKCRLRNRICKIVNQVPHLSVRPMLLAYAEDLINVNLNIKFSYQIYEEMIDAWLTREEGRIENTKKQLLRQFCEQLAVDIYIHRERRGSERIPKNDLVPLAKHWNIQLEDWQITGRSLLNRDAIGNYKFAHRSMMEYLFIKRFINGDETCLGVAWTHQMQIFFLEILQNSFRQEQILSKKLCEADLGKIEGIDFSVFHKENLSNPSEISKKEMYKKLSLPGKIMSNLEYNVEETTGGILIKDFSSGLMWQQSTPTKIISIDLEDYVIKCNKEKFAGHSDWRVPNLEEILPLIQINDMCDFNMESIFNTRKSWIIVRKF